MGLVYGTEDAGMLPQPCLVPAAIRKGGRRKARPGVLIRGGRYWIRERFAMDRTRDFLYNPAMDFIRAHQPDVFPQLLAIDDGGRHHSFGLLRANRQFRPATSSRPGTPHVHDVYHLVLYLSAGGGCHVWGRRHPIRRGMLLLTSPGEPHAFHAEESAPILYKEMAFALEGTGGDACLPYHEVLSRWSGTRLEPRREPILLGHAAARRLERRLDELMEVFDGAGPLLWYRAHRAVGEVFDFLLREVFAPEWGVEGARAAGMEQARQMIEIGYRDPLRIEDLAACAHLSPSQFQRVFRKTFGITPIRYQLELRMKLAARMLVESAYPVGEIALRCGYSDVYYFSRAFRKAHGLSPRAFRNREIQTRPPASP